MRLAKADDKDFDNVRTFLQACENSLERQKYSLCNPEDYWEEWDEDDEDKQRLTRIKKSLAKELGYSVKDVDNRLVVYEWLTEKFAKASFSWGRVTMAASVLIENMCDPTVDYVEFYPGFECSHVANEQ